MNGSGLELRGLSVALDGREVISGIDLQANPGEMLVLAGPSGSGKSTLLRAIAGLLPIRSGQIRIDGRRIDQLAPGRRDVAMVFQNHAVMPHMKVLDNLCFGLRARGMRRAEAIRRAEDMAGSLGLSTLLSRLPGDLSGGERQRVALGRALLRNARVILMDEPLSSLDGPLRARLRSEIVAIHERIETTIVYVTHDQTEALGMADRLGVIHDGRLLQLAPPREVYQQPAQRFVASFFGQPAVNLLTIISSAGEPPQWAGQVLDLPPPAAKARLQLAIRPEHVQVHGSRWARDLPAAVSVSATLHRRETLGDVQILHLDIGGERLTARVEPDFEPTAEQIEISLPRDALLAFDETTGERLW